MYVSSTFLSLLVCGPLLALLLAFFVFFALVNIPIYYGYYGILVGPFDGHISDRFKKRLTTRQLSAERRQ